jgi:hypothetical protein
MCLVVDIELEGGQVAQGSFDGETEQIADAAHVASGGAGFVEDAVFSQDVVGDPVARVSQRPPMGVVLLELRC